MLRYITEKIPNQIGAKACPHSLTGHGLSVIHNAKQKPCTMPSEDERKFVALIEEGNFQINF